MKFLVFRYSCLRFPKRITRLQQKAWFCDFVVLPPWETKFTPIMFMKINYSKKGYLQNAYENTRN